MASRPVGRVFSYGRGYLGCTGHPSRADIMQLTPIPALAALKCRSVGAGWYGVRPLPHTPPWRAARVTAAVAKPHRGCTGPPGACCFPLYSAVTVAAAVPRRMTPPASLPWLAIALVASHPVGHTLTPAPHRTHAHGHLAVVVAHTPQTCTQPGATLRL
jgi:hypothetical protein